MRPGDEAAVERPRQVGLGHGAPPYARGAATGTARATPALHQELSAAYDTYVFRTVYGGGDEEPFTRFLLADNATAPGRALEAYASSLFQGTLLASHAARPGGGDVDDWLDGWLSRLQGLYLDVERWVSAYQQSDPARLAQFEVATAFYRADDPAVAVARALQRGEPVEPVQIEAALAAGANTSAYGQALELGLIYLRRASAFWRGESEDLVAENVIRSAG